MTRLDVERAMTDLRAAYDPTEPANLVGMPYPHEGQLRTIVEAQMVDGQMCVRLAPIAEEIVVTFSVS